tara:strand:- start:12903 stop:14291 length:1389 start_codon:yes stop_codon:yes gene_type:complete
MRKVTVTEKYRAVNEGSMTKKEFVRQMRQQYPNHITQFDGFDSSVQILKNRGLLFESTHKAFSGVKVYDDRPTLNYSLDTLERGLRMELAAMGITMPHQGVNSDDYFKAEKKAKENLEKNPNHYLELISGESNKVDKHDKPKHVKRGALDKDTFNDLKKASLKEGAVEKLAKKLGVDVEKLQSTIKKMKKGEELATTAAARAAKPEFSEELETEEMSEDTKKTIIAQTMSAIRNKYPAISDDILKDFLKTHYHDLLDGSDPVDEFEEFVSVNYEGPSDYMDEKQGKDHDGDGDIDSDDYLKARDKAIKKAMGKDEQIKEAIKTVIRKVLTEESLNEAATNNLASYGESYAGFENVKSTVNELENIVTEIEQFYEKISEKIAKAMSKSSDFKNLDGMKVGAFIAPALEDAFKKDLRPVLKRGFLNKVELPKVRTISQADIDAHRSGERPLGEDEKSTVFTPKF